MPKILPYAALAAVIAIAGPALAQAPAPATAAPLAPQAAPPASVVAPLPTAPLAAAPAPAITAPAATAATAPATTTTTTTTTAPKAAARTGASTDTAANAGASTTLMSGMSVKDNTGALIGEVKSVKAGVATIQMGSDTFTLDSNKLGVANGAATINASQAELKKMLPAKK
jgi:hypothetical protein